MNIKSLLSISLSLFLLSGYAQINIGSIEKPTSRSDSGELKKPDLKKTQRNTLVFFYGESSNEDLENFKKAAEAWTFSKIVLDDIANLASYERKRGFSFVTLETEPVYTVNSNLGTKEQTGCQFYYHFWAPKGKDRLTFARIDLFLDHNQLPTVLKLKKPEGKVAFMYKQGHALNWGPGFMKLYFTHMSDLLLKGTTEALKDNFADKEALSKLEGEILFYPEYALTINDPRKGISEQTDEELFEDYPFEHEVMLQKDMDNLLFEATTGGDYILIYTLCGEDKHYNVYNSNGQLLFHRYEVKSYGLDNGDLKKLAKSFK